MDKKQKTIVIGETRNKKLKDIKDMIKSLKDMEASLEKKASKKSKKKTIKKEAPVPVEELKETPVTVEEPVPKEVAKEPKINGLKKLVKVSPELSEFLGIKPDETISRIETTKAIIKHIKDNGLQKGREFEVDDKLKALLGDAIYPINSKLPDAGNGYTYFNLQKYLKGHFN